MNPIILQLAIKHGFFIGYWNIIFAFSTHKSINNTIKFTFPYVYYSRLIDKIYIDQPEVVRSIYIYTPFHNFIM